MNNQQSLNVRQAVNPEINSPSLRITANPVSTAVQAVDTSRQYLGSSNAIAQSIVDFGKTLGNFGGYLSNQNLQDAKIAYMEREQLKDTSRSLELLKAQNAALSAGSSPGVTLSDTFNTAMVTLGSLANTEKVQETFGATLGAQRAVKLTEDVTAKYNAGGEGFTKGNFQGNAVKVQGLFQEALTEAESIPNELTKEAYKNSLLKQRDALLGNIMSLDMSFGEKVKTSVLNDAMSKGLQNLLVAPRENRVAILEDMADTAQQLAVPETKLVDGVTKALLARVGSGALTAEEAKEFLTLPVNKKTGVTLGEYVDANVFNENVSDAQRTYEKAKSSIVTEANLLHTTEALGRIENAITSTTDVEALKKLEDNLKSVVVQMFTAPQQQASAYQALQGNIQSRRQHLLVSAASAQKELATARLKARTAQEEFSLYDSGVKPWSLSAQTETLAKVRAVNPDMTKEELQKTLRTYGLPDMEELGRLTGVLNIPGVSEQDATANLGTAINSVVSLASALKDDTTGKFRYNLTKALQDDSGNTKESYLKTQLLLEEIRDKPILLNEANREDLRRTIRSVMDAKTTMISDAAWEKAVKNAAQDGYYSRAFDAYVNSPSTRLKASIQGFDDNTIGGFLREDFKKAYVPISDNSAVSASSLLSLTGEQDTKKAVPILQGMLRDATLYSHLKNSDVPNDVIGDEGRIKDYIQGKTLEISAALKTSYVYQDKSNPYLLKVYTSDGVPLTVIDTKKQGVIQRFSLDVMAATKDTAKNLSDALGVLSKTNDWTDDGTVDTLERATAAYRSLKELNKEELAVYAPEMSESVLEDMENTLIRHHENRLKETANASKTRMTLLAKSYPSLKAVDNQTAISIMREQRPIGALLKTGNRQKAPMYMPGFSEHNLTNNDAPDIQTHLLKSIEAYNATDHSEYAERSLKVYNILADSAGELSVAPKGSKNFFGFSFADTGFLDEDAQRILDGSVNLGFPARQLPEKLQAVEKDKRTASLTPGMLRSVRSEAFKVKQEVLVDYFKDYPQPRNFEEFAKHYPEKTGALTFLAFHTGKNFKKLMDVLNDENIPQTEKANASFQYVLKGTEDKQKKALVENALLMFYGGVNTWKAYHFDGNQ